MTYVRDLLGSYCLKISLLMGSCFCLLRPFHQVFYANETNHLAYLLEAQDKSMLFHVVVIFKVPEM